MLDNKATDTHSEYVIFIAFPRQQWLLKSASMLRDMYTGCLVFSVIFATPCRLIFFFHSATARSGPGPSHYRGFTITLS
jgi:hypothetical protein